VRTVALRAFFAAVAATFLLAGASAQPDGRARPPELTDLQFGRLLVQAGRLRDARAFLEQARPDGEDEAIERLFMLGRIEMQLGLPREAARRFEAILARRPDLPRVRLELAAAYFMAARDEKARYHFEAALAERLPASVETEIRRFLDRIDNRRRWSSSFALALVPESNPAHRTERRTVRIGGVPWDLDADGRARSGTGVLMSGGMSFSPAVGGGLSGALAATASAKLYRRREWNDVSVAGDVGLAWPADRYAISGGLRAGRRWLGQDGFSRSIGPWMRGSMRLSDRTRAGVASDVARVVHDEHPDRDGWRWSARPGVFHALSSRSSMEVELDLEAVSSRAQRLGSRMAGLSMTISHAFEGGVSISPAIGVWRRRYRSRDPIFGETRTDATIRTSVTVLHRSLQFEGFAPYVGYSFEIARSNIAIHSYRNHAVLVGVSRRF